MYEISRGAENFVHTKFQSRKDLRCKLRPGLMRMRRPSGVALQQVNINPIGYWVNEPQFLRAAAGVHFALGVDVVTGGVR